MNIYSLSKQKANILLFHKKMSTTNEKVDAKPNILITGKENKIDTYLILELLIVKQLHFRNTRGGKVILV